VTVSVGRCDDQGGNQVTVPAWVWVASAAALIAVAGAEVILTRRAGGREAPARSAVTWVGVYVLLAVLLGLGIAVAAGWVAAGQFYAGYLTEYSLSLDNLFIFYVIMSRLAVQPARQHRVLLLGIGLALVLRSVLIVAGLALITRFDWLFYPLGALMLWTAAGLIRSRPGAPQQEHTRLTGWLQRHARPADAGAGHLLVSRRAGRLVIAPGLLLVAAIAVADVLFAFDSIPAIFGITTSAYLIVAGNALALMGLRQVYVLLTRVLDRIVYLNKGLAVICAFIGVKLVLEAIRGSGVSWAADIPAWLSVTVVVAILAVTTAAGAIRTGGRTPGAADGTLLARRFAVLDAGGTGVWRRGDYERIARRLCDTFGHAADSGPGQAVTAGQRALFDALLRHMDSDGDQEISRDEFAAAVGRPIQDLDGFEGAVRAAADALVQAADRDGNQVLDAAEYAELTTVYGASADEAARAFKRLDTDRNGVLDRAELAAAIRQFFASPDPGAAGNLAFGRF
jgi:tellurite resistance protein TerC